MQYLGMEGMLAILNLDLMNIRGTQIAVGVDILCDGELAVFIKKINANDSKFVSELNSNSICKEECKHTARVRKK